MSGQAKRSRVRAAVRHREQVARLIVAACWPDLDYDRTSDRARRVLGSPVDSQAGTWFDVALARDYANRLIAEGQRDSETWSVFVDWCRAQGLGPDEYDHVLNSYNPWLDSDMGRGGGWPGHLPAEWARGPGRVTCDACDGRGVNPSSDCDPDKEPCSACSGFGHVVGLRPQPGEPKVRMGKRLLAALEGQPSECQVPQFPGGHQHNNCSCRGTGHNIAGVLPPIEWSPVVRRGVADGWDSSRRREVPAWQVVFGQGVEFPRDTRSVPRGAHRYGSADEPPGAFTGLRANVAGQGYQVGDLIRVRGYGVGRWAPRSTHRKRKEAGWEDLMPRWRRGELRHERQRAVRRSSADAPGVADGFMAMLGDVQAQPDDRRDAAPEWYGSAYRVSVPEKWSAPPPLPDETTEQYRQRLINAVNAIPGVAATAVAENDGRADITATFTEPPTVTIVVD